MATRILACSLAVAFISSFCCQSVAQEITIKIEQKQEATKDAPFTGERPAVDVAILLDTSNSMDGLINQAKAQLWKIVQEFAAAEKAGMTPSLRVAVFEYGNTNLPAKEGYIRQVVPLTDNLDVVSEGLFALSTNGGDEYCGMVIDEAMKRLDWSTQTNAYKAIFVAGNEPFTQGGVDYQKACRNAIENGVVVNTIHCGDYQTGVRGKWKHGAELAEGEYMNINQDKKVVQIKCPQDQIIIQLNSDLNKTYLWFGQKKIREFNSSNQVAQDANAQKLGSVAGRAISKSSSLYSNQGRCLVDTYQKDASILKKVKKEELPEAMQKMTVAERQKHIEEMAKRRATIKSKIAKLAKERADYIAKVQKEAALKNGKAENTLGDVMTDAVRSQLKKSGFKVKK